MKNERNNNDAGARAELATLQTEDFYFYVAGPRRRIFKFQPGGNSHVRFQRNGRDVLKSLRTVQRNLAEPRAKKLIEGTAEAPVTDLPLPVRLLLKLESRVKKLKELFHNGGAQ